MPRDLFFGTSGPTNARIAIVGESWGREEAVALQPFVGQSGQEFTRILSEGGVNRDNAFITNCFAERPPNNDAWEFFEETKAATAPSVAGLFPSQFARMELDRLYDQLRTVRPDIVIATGNYALWALTDRAGTTSAKDRIGRSVGRLAPSGITSYRGSMLWSDTTRTGERYRVLPIIHPAAILQQWSLRSPTVHDISARVPLALADDWRPKSDPVFLAPPTFEQACATLKIWLRDLEAGPVIFSVDVETLPSLGLLVCTGICCSLDFAMSVPWLRIDADGRVQSYWTIKEEATLIGLFRRLLLHPNVRLVGQNFAYDMQWFRRDWGTQLTLTFDTMLGHHLIFPGTPKDLGYLSSMYCHYHWYWKNDSKEWHFKEEGLNTLLTYNCVDVTRTLEIATEVRTIITEMGMDPQWAVELEKHDLAVEMMNRGVKIDQSLRAKMSVETLFQSQRIQGWLEAKFPTAIFGSGGKTAWYSSPAQTKTFFYEYLQLKEVVNRKTGNATTGKEALEELEQKYPALRKLFQMIRGLRSLGVFQSHFLNAALDPDQRMRCFFNTSGTESFRWSSSENAFGRGTNLQNIPSGNEDE